MKWIGAITPIHFEDGVSRSIEPLAPARKVSGKKGAVTMPVNGVIIT